MSKKRKSSETRASDTSPSLTDNSNPSVIKDASVTPTNIQSSSVPLVQDTQEFTEENIKGALLDWLKEQLLYQTKTSNEKQIQENIIKDLADGIIPVIKQTPDKDDLDTALLEEIKKHTEKFPVDPNQKSSQRLIDDLPTQILDHLKNLQLFQDISLRHDHSTGNKNIKKKAAVILLEDIANWVQNLPAETEDATIKEQLESKLVHKIGELNMNADIFNDDFIYDDILGDEIENLLADMPGEEIKNNLLTLKKDLLGIVKKARKKIREENAGPIYKQQLYETISNTLPSFNLSVEGKASFEVLKDDVVDAFINMHYVGNDVEEEYKLKMKIKDEIHTFCNKYLKRCPASPLDTSKLNEALFKALKTIVEPQNEAFIDDVELLKIKHEINIWALELPLKNQFGQEKLHTNKMISLLAKKIFDLENEKELVSPEEYSEKMKKEILKFLSKLPMTTENSDDIDEFVEKLVKIIKETEETRKLNASFRCCDQTTAKIMSKAKLRITFQDASSSPCPVNTCSQTSNSGKCPSFNPCLPQKNSSAQTPCKRMQAVGSQIDVVPNVVVNEYHWDSFNESNIQSPRVPCPCPTPSRPPYVVMPQPLQSPMSRGDESCMSPPCRPAAPTTSCPPYEAIPQRPQSPASRRTSDLKSCLTSRPYPMQPFEKRFNKSRDPDQGNPCTCAQHQSQEPPSQISDYDYDDYDYPIPDNQSSFRCDPQTESTLVGKQYSNQSFVLDDNNNSFPKDQHPNPCQLQRTPSSSPPYPYHLSINPLPDKAEPCPQRNLQNSSNQYSRSVCPCPSNNTPEQRNGQENQYNSFNGCPRSPQMRSRRPQQDEQLLTASPFMASSPAHFSQGQPCLAPRSSVAFSPPPQMPCPFPPRSPCYMRPEPLPLSPSEEYDSGLNCSYQKSATHLGAFEDEEREPSNCTTRYQDWDKVRDEFEYWGRERPNFNSQETNSNREGRKCKVCKQRHGEFNARRF